MSYSQDELKRFQPQHAFFIGFDSDGCVFDTMELKQKECFCPVIIRIWRLQPIAKYVRETVEFVNLYSKWRGMNRFAALVKVFDYLEQRSEVKARGFKVPKAQGLRDWINSGAPLGNASLEAEIAKNGDPDLIKALEWSNAVNEAVAALAYGIPPFPYVKASLEKLSPQADLLCVSQTPSEAIKREWAENELLPYAAIIAGQEYGTKKEHLALAAGGKYPANHILMVGDAEGDLVAAKANGALFYPIKPGREEASWKRFYEEALDKFFAQAYEGDYEAELIREFKTYLPETPPWQAKI